MEPDNNSFRNGNRKKRLISGCGPVLLMAVFIAGIMLSGCKKEKEESESQEIIISVTGDLKDDPACKIDPDNNDRTDPSDGEVGLMDAYSLYEASDPYDPEKEGNITEYLKGIDGEFYITEIGPELFERIRGKTYKEDCTIPLSDLRYLHVLNRDIDGNIHEGEMICNRYIAEDVLDILKELFEAGYPIEKIRLADEYDASDERSMEDNNSSCFNFRFISHTKKVSKHGMGLAVDINPRYNPYIKTVDEKTVIEPAVSEEYTHRERSFPYKIEEDDLCCRLFKEHGFIWGGNFTKSKDYQHFEMPDSVVDKLYP